MAKRRQANIQQQKDDEAKALAEKKKAEADQAAAKAQADANSNARDVAADARNEKAAKRDEDRRARAARREQDAIQNKETAELGAIDAKTEREKEAAAEAKGVTVDKSDPLQMLKTFASQQKSAFTQEAKALDAKEKSQSELNMASEELSKAQIELGGYEFKFNFVVIDKMFQTYAFPVSDATLASWLMRMREVMNKEEWHYVNKSYDLPYDFATGSVTL
jgi:hypothetical protein